MSDDFVPFGIPYFCLSVHNIEKQGVKYIQVSIKDIENAEDTEESVWVVGYRGDYDIFNVKMKSLVPL